MISHADFSGIAVKMQPLAHTAHAQPAGSFGHFPGYGNASFSKLVVEKSRYKET